MGLQVRRLTKSYRLAYRVDGTIIKLISTGDHKKIYGRAKPKYPSTGSATSSSISRYFSLL